VTIIAQAPVPIAIAFATVGRPGGVADDFTFAAFKRLAGGS
jgi:hypothetical protein